MTDDPGAGAPTKLTASKQRWAQEGRFLTGQAARPETERLPPGQHLVTNWPVLDLGLHPEVPLSRWRLEVFGAVERPVINAWDGVLTRDLLQAVAPRTAVRHVLLQSYDGYTTNLLLADFAAEGALLAHRWQGEPLAQVHGGPLRLVVPHLYFWKSAKWLQRIEFRTDDRPGFWEVRGYHNRGDPWAEQRYSEE